MATVYALHVCAEYVGDAKGTHVYAGVLTTEVSPFEPDFYFKIRDSVAAVMDPPRPCEKVVLRSMSTLAIRF